VTGWGIEGTGRTSEELPSLATGMAPQLSRMPGSVDGNQTGSARQHVRRLVPIVQLSSITVPVKSRPRSRDRLPGWDDCRRPLGHPKDHDCGITRSTDKSAGLMEMASPPCTILTSGSQETRAHGRGEHSRWASESDEVPGLRILRPWGSGRRPMPAPVPRGRRAPRQSAGDAVTIWLSQVRPASATRRGTARLGSEAWDDRLAAPPASSNAKRARKGQRHQQMTGRKHAPGGRQALIHLDHLASAG